MDLYFYTFAKVPSAVEDGEWISASSLPIEEPIFAFTKVVDCPDIIQIFANGGSSESLVFEGGLDDSVTFRKDVTPGLPLRRP